MVTDAPHESESPSACVAVRFMTATSSEQTTPGVAVLNTTLSIGVGARDTPLPSLSVQFPAYSHE